MKSIVAAIAALAFAVVSAQEQGIVYVTSPLTGATVSAGEPFTISWQQPQVDTITQIELRQGVSTSLQPVLTIASNVDAASGSYTWDVPSDITPGSDYALVFGTNPFAYSGTFSIEGGSGASSSAAPSASAAPSSSDVSSSAAPSSSVASSSAAPSSSSHASSSSAASHSVSKSQSATDAAETDESAAVKSQPAALAALAIAGVAAVAMI